MAKVNQFEGECSRCGKKVPARGGFVSRRLGGWQLYHHACTRRQVRKKSRWQST